MGNSASRDPGEEIYKATASNDCARLQRVLQALQTQHRLNPNVFKWSDSDGRTALHLAAAKNFHHAARMLLQHGADVHHMSPKLTAQGGTALHEATHNRHEAMAELLLSFRANPFMSNLTGRTCVDEAVAEGAGNLLRRYETLANWRGNIAVKTSKLGGLTQPYKTRYLVVMPFIPAPQPNQPPPAPRVQLWIYRDHGAIVPKSRVWLDGATTHRVTPNDIILRLHPSHKPPPGDLATRYDRGYCINLRIADATTASANALAQFEQLVNGASAAPAAATQQTSYPAIPSVASSFTSTPASSQHPSQNPTPSGSGGGNTTALPPRAAPATPARTQQQPVPPVLPPVLTTATSYVSSTGRPVDTDDFVNTMRALPGESDQDFASRLASAISAQSGQDQSSPLPRTASAGNTPTSQRPAALSGRDVFGAAPLATVTSTPAIRRPEDSVVQTLLEAPSAPPMPVSGRTGSGGGSETAEEKLCVICLSAPREAGYLHGTSVHLCVCRDCCSHVHPGAPCPLCRQPVERVINVY